MLVTLSQYADSFLVQITRDLRSPYKQNVCQEHVIIELTYTNQHLRAKCMYPEGCDVLTSQPQASHKPFLWHMLASSGKHQQSSSNSNYSGTLLIWSLMGHKNLATVEPHSNFINKILITLLNVPPLSQFPNEPVFLPEVVCYFHHQGREIELSQEKNADHSTCETNRVCDTIIYEIFVCRQKLSALLHANVCGFVMLSTPALTRSTDLPQVGCKNAKASDSQNEESKSRLVPPVEY